ncbi:hypothetical protein PPACK8108_LOCUS23589 [Phakopsora pachyrhizi]|uniref:Secreted protein n=1 Tax=Phakopsora pachyrhizi TaxID=170000 RepID=A0A0S1MJM4_PHAPC|nr:hypothetical protein PPACK8108_LOCUS23589 [Phakopsora pachyrhizi]
MRSLIVPTLLCVLFIHKSCATVHTQCYNYFLQKDGCVFSAADDRNRCSADPKPSTAVGVVQESNKNVKRHTLARRYDTTLPSPSIQGEGICGHYDTATAEGASLWVGPNPGSTRPEEAGWLNRGKTSNCNKRLYVINPRTGKTVYIKVIDGHDFQTTQPDVGCFQIALTQKTFLELDPTDEEKAKGAIGSLTWDFDNLHGISPQQGPV